MAWHAAEESWKIQTDFKFNETSRDTLIRGIGGKVWIKHKLDFFFFKFLFLP